MTEVQEKSVGEPEQMGIEETFEALEGTIKKLEDGSGSLEEAFASFEEGMKLVKSCHDKIDRVEKRIQILGGEVEEE